MIALNPERSMPRSRSSAARVSTGVGNTDPPAVLGPLVRAGCRSRRSTCAGSSPAPRAGVDGRVGDLRELLPEVGRTSSRDRLTQSRQRRVVAHRADRLGALGQLGDERQLLLGVAEGAQQAGALVARRSRSRRAGGRSSRYIWCSGQPGAVRPAAGRAAGLSLGDRRQTCPTTVSTTSIWPGPTRPDSTTSARSTSGTPISDAITASPSRVRTYRAGAARCGRAPRPPDARRWR